jgi:hypothetical protein
MKTAIELELACSNEEKIKTENNEPAEKGKCELGIGN